jgi:tripartite-type tricarboxylate transporter receptor subunit TctC
MRSKFSLVIARSKATKQSIFGRRCKMDCRVASLLAMTMAGLASPALADPVEDFYKGRTVNMIIGLGEGGGYDFSARLVAQHLGEFLPGKPTIVPRNMPGAGSIAAAEHV